MGAGVVGLGLAGSLLSSCAKRQQKISPEELTTATLEEDTVAAMSYRTDNVWLDEYIVRQDIDLNKVVLQEEEVSEVKFATFDEIENLFHNNSVF